MRPAPHAYGEFAACVEALVAGALGAGVDSGPERVHNRVLGDLAISGRFCRISTERDVASGRSLWSEGG